MTTDWNWTMFFYSDEQSDLFIPFDPARYHHYLSEVSFRQGLQIIVSGVPQIEKQQWPEFLNILRHLECPRFYREAWLQIARTMKRLLPDVRRLLNSNNIQEIVRHIEAMFCQADAIGKFGLVACLNSYSSSLLTARVVLDYLRQHYDFQAQQLEKTYNFYASLTPRQKDVAALAAQGYANSDIADELVISEKVVAEHLTAIFERFVNALTIITDSAHGVRYRLIHHLTRLFDTHPELLLQRALR